MKRRATPDTTPTRLLDTPTDDAAAGGPAGPALGAFGIDLDAMDRSVRPGDDFYRYVNGAWLDSFELPADKARYGIADALSEKAMHDVRAILEDLAAADHAVDTTERKAAEVYAAFLDTATVDARAFEPVRDLLDAVEALTSTADLWPLFASHDHTAPFRIGIGMDPSDSTRYCVMIGQAGLGMPDRDFYLRPGERSEQIRDAYRTYVTRVFELLGDADPAAAAERVIDLETALAAVQWPMERRRIVKETVNPMDRDGLAALAPEIAWDVVFRELGLGAVERLVVRETTAVSESAELIVARPLEDWQAYLRFHVVDGHAPYLHAPVEQARFEFFGKTLRGTETQVERWKRGVALINHALGESVSAAYVERHFPAGHKAAMDELVRNVLGALRARLQTLPWMDDATRAEAERKLAAFDPRIGHPDAFRDYGKLEVHPGKLIESLRAIDAFEWDRQVGRLHDPVDRDEWSIPAQVVNAYYHPMQNQVVFPAAILQPPYFDPHADAAVNYGGIGAVIAHEISHGFDDQGREFDGDGNVRNWWTPETDARFMEATARLVEQFDGISAAPGVNVNGRLTLGENIGDLGGIEISLTAYRNSLGDEQPPVIDGFTGLQRFFLSWAQVWRSKIRPDALRNQVLTDPHSPASVRGGFLVRNVDAWYEAFGVTEGDAEYLAPEARVRIW